MIFILNSKIIVAKRLRYKLCMQKFWVRFLQKNITLLMFAIIIEEWHFCSFSKNKGKNSNFTTIFPTHFAPKHHIIHRSRCCLTFSLVHLWKWNLCCFYGIFCVENVAVFVTWVEPLCWLGCEDFMARPCWFLWYIN